VPIVRFVFCFRVSYFVFRTSYFAFLHSPASSQKRAEDIPMINMMVLVTNAVRVYTYHNDALSAKYHT
jgi:hypothetical protein